MKIKNREQFLETKKEVEAFKQTIEQLLKKQDYNSFREICELMEDKKSVALAAEDKELYILQLMTNIQRQEMTGEETRYLFEGRNIRQLVNLYQEIVFYLRRLEFDLPLEEQKELIDYMLKEQLSAVCIFGIVQAARYIYAKEKTLHAFMNLLAMK